MRICLINNLYKPFSRGGADRITSLIADELIMAGHNVFIITTRPYFSKHKLTDKTTEKIYYLPSLFNNLQKIPLFLRFFWHIYNALDVRICWRIKKIISREKADLIIANNLMGLSQLLPLLSSRIGIPYVQILHDIQLLHPSGLMFYGEENKLSSWSAFLWQKFNRYLCSKVNLVITPSQWLLDTYKQYGFFVKQPSLVLPNPQAPIISEQDKAPLENSSIQNNNDKLNNTSQPKTIDFLYVGEISYHKGVPFLIEVFLKNKLKVNLTLIGEGQSFTKLKKQCLGYNNINFLGWKKNQAVKELMKQARCLILPSLCYENSPTVIYEAASNELPIIASRIGGIPELIQKTGGLLFTPGSEKELLSLINHCYNNNFNTPIKAIKNEEYSQKILSFFK
jgi:glycosyltransferase involved in cell wall biosynthesis